MAGHPSIDRAQGLRLWVPGSTSNLGPGFDALGLALQVYLEVDVVRAVDDGAGRLQFEFAGGAPAGDNAIEVAMRDEAKRRGVALPSLVLAVRSGIPVQAGLGSSAAAIVAGIRLSSLLTGKSIADQTILNYATEFEGHPDNVAASLYGGFLASCIRSDGTVLSTRFDWPAQVRVVVVSPHSQLPTHVARAALPRTITRTDAVHNLQRTALFTAALAQQRYDLFWEAMRDRLHQPYRESLVPGLAEALALPRMPGLLGIALSGAGPSIVALVENNEDEIGARIAKCFAARNTESTTRTLDVDNEGALPRSSL